MTTIISEKNMLRILSVFVLFIVLSCLRSFIVFFSYQCILFDTLALNNRPYTLSFETRFVQSSVHFKLGLVHWCYFAKDQKSFEDCCCSQDLPYFLMRVERGGGKKWRDDIRRPFLPRIQTD